MTKGPEVVVVGVVDGDGDGSLYLDCATQGGLGPPQTYATATAACQAAPNRHEFCGFYPVCELKATPQSVAWVWSGRK